MRRLAAAGYFFMYWCLLVTFPLGVFAQPSAPTSDQQDETIKRITSVLEQAKEIIDRPAAADDQAPSPAPTAKEVQPVATPAPVTSTQIQSEPQVRDTTDEHLPKSPAFWRFHDWYIRHAVVSLIVNGDDREQLVESLDTILTLRDRRYLRIGKVIVVGTLLLDAQKIKKSAITNAGAGLKELAAAPINLSMSDVKKRLNMGRFREQNSADAEQLVRRLVPEYSPVWVVRFQGREYVYEGKYDVRRIFGPDGTFQGSEFASSPRQRRSSGTKMFINPPQFNQPITSKEGWFSVFNYEAELANAEPGIGTYDVLAECARDDVRSTPAPLSSPEASQIDIVYYLRHSQTQRRSAANWPGLTVPFIESAAVNPYFDDVASLQSLARLFGIRCLPTRVYYRVENGRRMRELREGKRAWELLPNDFAPTDSR